MWFVGHSADRVNTGNLCCRMDGNGRDVAELLSIHVPLWLQSVRDVMLGADDFFGNAADTVCTSADVVKLGS